MGFTIIGPAKYKAGHKVMVEADRPFCTGGPSVIKQVGIRYNELTGDGFHVYEIDDKWWDEKGACYSHPEYMYTVIYDIPQDTEVSDLENEMLRILYSEDFDDGDKVNFLKDLLK